MCSIRDTGLRRTDKIPLQSTLENPYFPDDKIQNLNESIVPVALYLHREAFLTKPFQMFNFTDVKEFCFCCRCATANEN